MTEQTGPASDAIAAIDMVRALRRRGDMYAAIGLVDATLAQRRIGQPATVPLANHAGWLHLERAHAYASIGKVAEADRDAIAAMAQFERADDRGAQAASCLLVGDLNEQAGQPARAAMWWQRARSLAESAGSTPLAARALASLALSDLRTGQFDNADVTLAAAEDRAAQPLQDAVAKRIHKVAGDAAPAGQQATGAEPEKPATGTDLRDQWVEDAAAVQDQVARATIALVRARQAIAGGDNRTARLLLSVAAEAGRELGATSLHIDALRLDAAVARREADPRSAVESLTLAANAAREAGLEVAVAGIEAELVLALVDNEQWDEAFALQQREPSAAVAALPGVAAGRLEAFAVLSRKAGRLDAAHKALEDAARVRAAAGDAAGRVRTVALLANVALAGGSLDAAEQAASIAASDGRRTGRLDAVVSAEIAMLRIRLRRGRHDEETIAAAQTLCDAAATVGTVAQRVVALDLCAALQLAGGDAAAAAETVELAIAAANDQPLLRLRAGALARRADVRLAQGAPRDAAHAARDAAEIARESEDHESHARALFVAGRALRALGRHDEALLAATHAAEESAASGRPDIAGHALYFCGNSNLAIGRHREALLAFGRALEIESMVSQPRLRGSILRGIAACQRALGDGTTAIKTLGQAAAIDDELVQALCQVDAATIEVDLGRHEAALATLEAIDQDALDKAGLGDLLTLRARCEVALDKKTAAAATLKEAVQAHRAGDPRGLGAALYLLGQVEGMLGNGQACGDALGEALIITARLGLPERHMIRRTIERLHTQAGTP